MSIRTPKNKIGYVYLECLEGRDVNCVIKVRYNTKDNVDSYGGYTMVVIEGEDFERMCSLGMIFDTPEEATVNALKEKITEKEEVYSYSF